MNTSAIKTIAAALIVAPVVAMGAFFLTFMAAMAYGVISSNLAERKAR